MSSNIINRVQENLQYPPLKKIDPNTEQVVHQPNSPDKHSFGQAAIPAILAAFSEYVQSDEGASDFLNNMHSGNWIQNIFGDRQDEVVHAVSNFSLTVNDDPYFQMQAIADEIVKTTMEQLPANPTTKDVKDFYHNEKVDFLSYLLPELKVGVLLGDESMDDQTHKMDGGLSGLVQKIGAAFDHADPVEKNGQTPWI